ncbi:predicted protein [Histoplasma capsulatum G186AR]|uniref:Uncharacterized protein n=1 Tax=Ajellomyces capsulatus (strain G186AR / H82 / ATCC MYA-2454 / RMSCC 2432) TaxID=447093 RepID=C0NX89_AJECG|nr:uncharacterized protein HCBG_08081 [Histoplasma capsulatum G186AR]EEH03955.1 predicted protein [Histoplasma capsulatum G186AR]
MTPQGQAKNTLARDSTVDQPKSRLMMDFFRNTGPTPPGNPDHVKGVPTKGGDASSIEKGRVPNRADFAIGMWKVSPFSFRPMQILGSPVSSRRYRRIFSSGVADCDREASASENIFDIELRRLITPAVGLKDGIAPADEIHAEVRSQHSNDTAGSPIGNRSKRSRLQEFQNCSSIIPLRQISLINPESPSVMAGRRGCRTQVRSDGDRSVDGIRTYSTRGTSSSRATSISPVSGHHDAKAGRGRCGRGDEGLKTSQGQDTNNFARPASTRTAHVPGAEFPVTQDHDLPEKNEKSIQCGDGAQACPIQVNWSSYALLGEV